MKAISQECEQLIEFEHKMKLKEALVNVLVLLAQRPQNVKLIILSTSKAQFAKKRLGAYCVF